ncbi:low affinity immunoglobulin epsilon Fc receptor [Suncus etruscus]|uniref:low affinity immunoglobulin epsilon Fc receptor n=1 Tax=Suncus etruscus TaxID=109475 RepID=UPI0021102306|nr:low affinity immunoglobulin epsilon Fc receptor [Suncus etruscus]
MEESSYSEVPVEFSRKQRLCCCRGVKLALLGLLMAALWAGLLTLLLLWHWDTTKELKQLGEKAAQNVSQVSHELAKHKGQQITQESQAAQMMQDLETILEEQKTMKYKESEFSKNLDVVLEDLSSLKSRALNTMHSVWSRLEKLQKEVSKLWIELRVANGSQCNTCPQDWVNFQRKCYYFGRGSKRWLESWKACQQLNGKLVSIHSQEEQDFLTNHTSKLESWIGLRDLELEGEFIWIDQEPLNYSNWDHGEPNNRMPSEDCVMMRGSGKWNDAYCLRRLDSWVCELLVTC